MTPKAWLERARRVILHEQDPRRDEGRVPMWTREDEENLAERVRRASHEYTPRYPDRAHGICTCGLAESYCRMRS